MLSRKVLEEIEDMDSEESEHKRWLTDLCIRL